MSFWVKILVAVVSIEILGSASGLLSLGSIEGWYQTLDRPSGTPPNAIFGPVWTLLYAAIGTALARVWHRAPEGEDKRAALTWFAGQFALNLAWTPVFFGAHWVGLALLLILLLLAAIAETLRRFSRLDRVAGWLLCPYLLWVAYASYLNAGFWWLNR